MSFEETPKAKLDSSVDDGCWFAEVTVDRVLFDENIIGIARITYGFESVCVCEGRTTFSYYLEAPSSFDAHMSIMDFLMKFADGDGTPTPKIIDIRIVTEARRLLELKWEESHAD